jgi:hypothetical protein
MQVNSFNDCVMKYKRSGKGLKVIVEAISLFVYSILKYQYKMDDDERGDFFCIFYPKIPGLIKRFKYFGTSFDGYLNISVRWSIKAYRSKNSKHRSLQITSHRAPFYLESPINDFTIVENDLPTITETARAPLRLSKTENILSETMKQRLLYLYLLESDYLDERLKEGIIKITGYKRKWLDICSDKLRKRTENRLIRIEKLKNSRNNAFFQFHLIQEKYNFAESQEEKEIFQIKINSLRKRIYKMNDEISKAPTRPTHRDLSDVLEVPKGSIDSGIYYIKTAFKGIDKLSA